MITISRRFRLLAALVALSGLLLAACGDDDGGSDAAPTDTPPPTEATDIGNDGETSPDTPDAPYVESTETIGETIWFEGFTFELDEVWTRVWNNEQTDTDVRVSGTVTNLVDDSGRVPGPVFLSVGTFQAQAETAGGFVDAESSTEIDLRWQIPADADIADAVLYFGDESLTRAQLALGAGGTTRTNEPVELETPDLITIEGYELDLHTVEVHFDRPLAHSGRFEGAAYVWFRGEVTNVDGEGNRRPSFRLHAPNGDDHVMNVRLGGSAGDLELGESEEIGFSYEIPADLAGDYYLVPTGGLPSEEPPRVFEFTVPDLLD